jgi:hypothetical protein
MEPTLAEAIEVAVHAAGELTLEGIRLTFKEEGGVETKASVTEFDKEANVFLVRETTEKGEVTKAISRGKFKFGLLASIPSDRMATFLAAWEEQVEPLLGGRMAKGKEGDKRKESSRYSEGKDLPSKGRMASMHEEAEGKERVRKTSSEPSLHSAFLKLGRRREAKDAHPKGRHSEHGDTSEVGEQVRRKKRSGSAFRFPEGVNTMEDFVAYLQPKLGQLPSNPVLVADVERRYAQIDQAKKGLHQTTGLLIRVYKAPQEWQRVLLLDLIYGLFIVAINGLFGYQQEALLTDGEAICKKAGPPGTVTPTKIEEMETQVREAFEKRYEKITDAVSKGRLPVSPKSK